MASDGEISCINDPNFAVICSFLDVFGKICAIEPPSILELQELIENTQEVLEPLKQLHLKLLRRTARSGLKADRWEKYLIKFCHQQSHHQEAWELERFGYKKASTTIKLKVLKILLEYQFTCYTKFKSAVNQLESSEIRLNPMGRDNQGRTYWLLMDFDANLRLYREDQDKETWKLIASDRDGYLKVIDMLRSGESIEGLQESEDSNSLEEPSNTDAMENAENDNEEFLSPESESENDDNVNEKNSETVNSSGSMTNTTSQLLDNYAEDNACSSPPQSTSKKSETQQNTDDQKETLVQKQFKDVPTVEKITLKLGSGKDANFEIKSEENVPKSPVKNVSEETITPKRVKSEQAKKEENDNIKDLPSKRAKIEDSSETEKDEPSAGESDRSVEKDELPVKKDEPPEEKDKPPEDKDEPPEQEDDLPEDKDEPPEEKDEPPEDKDEPPRQKEKDDEIGEEIEEPLMLIQGEGEGAECDSPPFIIGEEICEPVFYIWGSGCGHACDMGNPSLSASENDVQHNTITEPDKGSSKSSNKQKCGEVCSENTQDSMKSVPEAGNSEVNVSEGVSLNSVPKDIQCNEDKVLKSSKSPDNKKSPQTNNAPSTSSSSFGIEKMLSNTPPQNISEVCGNKSAEGVSVKEVVVKNKNPHVVSPTNAKSSQNDVDKSVNNNSDTGVSKLSRKSPVKTLSSQKSNNDSQVESSDNPQSNADSVTDEREEKQSDVKEESGVESSCKENGIVKKSLGAVPNCEDNERKSNRNDKSDRSLKKVAQRSSEESKKTKTETNKSGVRKTDKSHTVVRRSSTESVLPGVPEVKKCRAESQESVGDQKKSNSEDESSNSKRKSICDPPNESCSKNYKKAESPSKEGINSKVDKSIAKGKSAAKKSLKEKDKIIKSVSTDRRNTINKQKVDSERDPLEIENVESDDAAILSLGISNQNVDGISEKSPDAESKSDVKIHGKHKANSGTVTKTIKPNKVELNQLPTKKLKLDSTSDENDTKVVNCDPIEVPKSKVMKKSVESSDDDQSLTDPLDIIPAAVKYNNSKNPTLDDSGIEMKKCRINKQDASQQNESDSEEKPLEARKLRHTKNMKLSEKNVQVSKGKKTKNKIKEPKEIETEDSSIKCVEKPEVIPKKREIILTIKEQGKRKIIKKQLVQKEDTSEKKSSLKRNQDYNLLGKRTREQSESLSDPDEDDVLAGKRLKMKPKKVILSTRKKIEQKLKLLKGTTDDDSESSEDTLIRAREKLKNTPKKVTPRGKSHAVSTKRGSSKKKRTQKAEEQIDPLEDLTPVRMSRRIAQLKIREEADRRQLEEVVLRELKEKHTKASKDPKDDAEWRDSSSDRASVNSTSQGAKGKPKKDKKGKDQKWGSSSGGSDSESEPEPLFEHDEREVVEVAPKSDHEFSPESDLENGEVAVPTRRARTVKKGDDAEQVLDAACGACGGRDQPDWILLCDDCDAGRHAACLKPILFVIPEGNWYCPPCDHERLIKNLESNLVKYDKIATSIKRQNAWRRWAVEEKADADEKNKKEEKSSGESSSGDSESSSGSEDGKVYRLRERRQLPVSYRFKEYDQLISSAIKEEYHEKPSTAGNQGRGKDISTIIEADKEEKQKAKIQAQLEADQNDPPEGQEGEGGVGGEGGVEGIGGGGSVGGGGAGGKEEAFVKRRERARAAAHRRRPRKLNSLEVISDDDDNSDEDFKEAASSSTTGSSEAEGSAEDSDSSHSSDSLPIRRSGRSGKKGRRKIVDSPELKKKKRVFDESSSSESSGAKDWSSKKKKKKSRHQRSSGHSHKSRSRKKRSPRPPGEKMKRCTVQYGGLSGSDESNGWSPAHRTRQKKINYTEMPNTESEDEVHKPSGKHMPDSSDEYKVDTDSTNSDSDKSNKKRKVGDSSDEGKKEENGEKLKDKPQTLSEMLKEQLGKKEGEPSKDDDACKKHGNASSGDAKAVPTGDVGVADGAGAGAALGRSPNKFGRGRGSRGPRGSRGGRGSRGPRGGRGGAGALNRAAGVAAVVPGNAGGAGSAGNAENVTSADGSTMQGLVGMKIKDLTQNKAGVEGRPTPEGGPVLASPPKPTLPTPFQLEREKKRLEKEAKMAEKELKKQERLKKKEEKDQQKEQKAKEREEKKMARVEQQIKKKKTNELMQPIPIAGMMQNPGLRVAGPHTQHLAANLPSGAVPHNAMKPGLSVRPFIGQMSTRDGQPHNFSPRGPMDGMRAYGPPGHHYFAGQHGYPPQEGLRHRYPGMTGPRGELIAGPRGEFMGGPRGDMARPRGEHMSGPREHFTGPRGEMSGPRGQFTGPRGEVMGPRGQFIGPRGEMTGPRGEVMGPRGQFIGPRGEMTGPRGHFLGPRGEFSGPRGEFPVPREEFSGSRGEFTGPRGVFSGPRGEFAAPRGEFTGPRGEFTGPRGEFNEPRGEFSGLKGEMNGPRGEFTGPRGEMMGPRGDSPGPRRESIGPRGIPMMGPRGVPMMGVRGEHMSGPREDVLPSSDTDDSEALTNLGRLAGENKQKLLKYPVDSRGISPHSSGSDSNPGSSSEHLRVMLTAPGQPPRLQVRAELRGIRPDFGNVGGGGGERRRGRGASRRGSGRGGAEGAGQARATPAQEGTLSVAGSPQPFKPAIDPPSIITRMPHMMPPHFRGSSMYGGNGPMYGSPRGPPPHPAMYGSHPPHPMELSPSAGGPPQRPPYPPGAYYPPQMHGGPYPMRYPAPYRPEAPQPEENQQPKVKFEIKTEPGFQTPPHVEVDSASPHSQDGVSRHLSPPPTKRTPPPQGVHDDTQRPPAHPKVKHTENKDRARARQTAASRYPHGPYAPQFGPYGPYAPPGSRPEYPPPNMSPSVSTATGPPATSAPEVAPHQPPPLSHQAPPLSHQPPPLAHLPPPLTHQPSPPPLSHQPPPVSHQPPPQSHQPIHQSHQAPPISHQTSSMTNPPPPLSHQPPPLLQAPFDMDTNRTPPMPKSSSLPSEAPTEKLSSPISESISAPLSLTTNRRPETPPSDTAPPETKSENKPLEVPRKEKESIDVRNSESNKFTPTSIVADQNDDTSESAPAEESNPRIHPNEEEGVFGGLVSYFSSQQEDDIDN